MSSIERIADKMIHIYDDGIKRAQWYFGSRTHDFYLYGVGELLDVVRQYPFIDMQTKPVGTLVKRGEPAIVVTINSNELLQYGNMIETLIYNRIWYASTVGTILHNMRDHLHSNGFDVYRAFPQMGRASVNEHQTKVASDIFSRVFYKLNDSLRSVATHNEILMTSETFCIENYHSVMADTYDIREFCKLANSLNYSGEIMVDSKPIIDNIEYVLSETPNTVCQVESVTREEWYDIVTHFSGNERVLFGIGSCCFTNVNRDTLGFVYKTCAIHRGDEWIAVSKQTKNKETFSGYVEEL
ncbi:nicotinamide phosphoribosyl transferase [Vibrio phage D480]|nr:nicotinate/nicotinamide phosphoribosyltransferase [Vibrio phage 6E35.1a]